MRGVPKDSRAEKKIIHKRSDKGDDSSATETTISCSKAINIGGELMSISDGEEDVGELASLS